MNQTDELENIDKTFNVLKKISYEEICNRYKTLVGYTVYETMGKSRPPVPTSPPRWEFSSVAPGLRNILYENSWTDEEFLNEANRRKL